MISPLNLNQPRAKYVLRCMIRRINKVIETNHDSLFKQIEIYKYLINFPPYYFIYQVDPIIQMEIETSFEFNHDMFQDVSLRDQLHSVEQPQIESNIFQTIQDGLQDLEIDIDGNDDQKSEICQETLQNTGFGKIPQKIVEQQSQTLSKKNNHRRRAKKPTKPASKVKIITHRKQGSKKDYKKNICGYITRRVLKQSLGTQYQQIIEDQCRKFQVSVSYFHKIYRAHNCQNITGPTHFYNLVNPRMTNNNLEENIKEISARMVFVMFFQWFVRNRYIRYLLGDGKMTQKDKYMNYKNREMMFMIASEQQQMLQRLQDNLKERFSIVETLMVKVPQIYGEMTEGNRIQMAEFNEQKKQIKQIVRTQLSIDEKKSYKLEDQEESSIGMELQSFRV